MRGSVGGERGTNVPSSGSTYKNNLHMVRHRGKILLRKVTCNSGESLAAHRGQSWPAVGGGGMKGKEMESGGRARGGGGGGPEQFNGALI